MTMNNRPLNKMAAIIANKKEPSVSTDSLQSEEELAEKERQKVLDNAESIKAETARLQALTQLEVIKGEREKPELLKQREQELNARQVELSQLKQTLDEQKTLQDAKDSEILGKLQRLDEREKILMQSEKDSLAGIKLEHDNSLKEIEEVQQNINDAVEETLTDFDAQVIERQEELSKLDVKIKSADAKLLETKQAIEETKKEIAPLIKTLEQYKAVAMQLYNQQHSKVEHARQGSKEETYHYKHAENLWNIKGKLKSFGDKLNKFLG